MTVDRLADTTVLPFGIPLGRHTHTEEIPLPPDTEPLPFPSAPQTQDLSPVQVKVSETCGPCGSTLSLEWPGRTDALRVLRDWRETHRCEPRFPDVVDATKESLIERVETDPTGFAAPR